MIRETINEIIELFSHIMQSSINFGVPLCIRLQKARYFKPFHSLIQDYR